MSASLLPPQATYEWTTPTSLFFFFFLKDLLVGYAFQTVSSYQKFVLLIFAPLEVSCHNAWSLFSSARLIFLRVSISDVSLASDNLLRLILRFDPPILPRTLRLLVSFFGPFHFFPSPVGFPVPHSFLCSLGKDAIVPALSTSPQNQTVPPPFLYDALEATLSRFQVPPLKFFSSCLSVRSCCLFSWHSCVPFHFSPPF